MTEATNKKLISSTSSLKIHSPAKIFMTDKNLRMLIERKLELEIGLELKAIKLFMNWWHHKNILTVNIHIHTHNLFNRN
jgi:hypothetical protein